MKKFYIFLGLLLISYTLTAQDLTIPKLSTAPQIDGVVDEIWNAIDQVDIAVHAEDDFGDATILEGYFKMGWNDTALFLLLRRSDDDFANQWTTKLPDWQSDRDEIFIDVNVDSLNDGRGASDAQNGASYGHYQFTSIWVEDATEWSGMPNQWYHNAPFHFGYKIDGDSYFSEYAFPFNSLTIDTKLLSYADSVFKGTAGVTFGLEITIADVDMADDPKDDSYRKFLRYKGVSGWDSMDSAGTVLLGSNIVTGVNEHVTNNHISVYPTIADKQIRLNNLEGLSNIRIVNLIGSVVLQKNNISNNDYIDVSTLPSGMYYLSINNQNISRFIKK